MVHGSINIKIPDSDIYIWGSSNFQAFECHSTNGLYRAIEDKNLS